MGSKWFCKEKMFIALNKNNLLTFVAEGQFIY